MGNQNNAEDEKKKKKRLIPIIIILAVLLLGGTAGLLAGLGVFKGQPAETSGEAEESTTETESEEPVVSDVEPQLWWNVDRMNYAGQSEIGTSSRQPDKDDGYYHITFSTEGRQVTRRVAEKKLVNLIDGNDLMALEFDENGIVVGVKLIDDCTGGYEVKGWYIVSTDPEKRQFTANSAATLQGMDEDFTLPEDCKIYDVSGAINYVGMEIKFEDLKEKDRIYTILNNEGKVYRAFITSRYVQPECYWNIERKYNTELLATTREPNEEGIYEIPMAYNGEQVIVKTKMRSVATAIDAQAAKCLGLTFDLDGFCTKAIYAGTATGGGTFGSWFHIMEMNGLNITAEKIVKATDTGTVSQGELAQNYRAFDVSGCGDFIGQEIFDLKVSDQIHAVKDNAGKICIVWVVGRLKDCEMYWNLERQYDSAKKQTTRTPDANGYYHLKLAVSGKQGEYITNDISIVNNIDSQAAKCGGIVVEGNVITKALSGGSKYGGSYAASWFDLLSMNGKTVHLEKIISATDTGDTWDGQLMDNMEVYNVSSNVNSFVGEKTTLRVGDRVHCFTDYKKNLAVAFVVARPVNSPVYWNISRMYNSTTKQTTRKPDADGYYNFQLAVNGGNVTYRTKDQKLASDIDAIAVRCFGLKVSGDIIQKVYAAAECQEAKGGSCASWYTVQTVNGRTFSSEKMSDPYKGEKATLTLASNAKIYNCGGLYTVIGEYTKLQVGDVVQCWKNANNQVQVAVVITRKAPSITAVCQECGKEVTWLGLTGVMSAQTDASGNPLPLTHYYVPSDCALASQGTTPYVNNGSYVSTSNVHVDLMGHTLTQGNNARMFAQFGPNQEIVVFDSSEAKTGKLVASQGMLDDKGLFFWTMSGNSKATFKDLSIDLSALDSAGGKAGFYNANANTEWTFQNVDITAGEGLAQFGAVMYSAGKVTLDNVTITGGKSMTEGSVVVPKGGKLYLKNNVAISGGKLADGTASSLYIEAGGLLYNDGLTAEDGAIMVSVEEAGAFTSTGFEGKASMFKGELEGSTITEKSGVLYMDYSITGISFTETETSVEIGTPTELSVKTLPGNMKGVVYTFTSSDESKVTVTSEGKVVGIAETGSTPVTVKATATINGETFEATVPVTVTAATTALKHYHAETVNSHIATDTAKINYTEWTSTTTLPTDDGYYYLASDVVLKDTYYGKENMNVHICLNGHTVKLDVANPYRTLSMFYPNETLSICDCSDGETGAVYAPEGGAKDQAQGRGVWVRYGTFNLYGGSIIGSEVTHSLGGGAICVGSGNFFNMYGGTLKDGYAHDTSTSTGSSSNGGNLNNSGTTTIYGGKIVGGIAGFGGNIYNSGTLKIYGGEITDGVAGYTKNADGTLTLCGNTWRCGGNIYSVTGTTYIYGGTISGGHAINGGNIYTSASTGVIIDGQEETVIIKDGYAESLGGNIYGDNNAYYSINNAEISNGTCINPRGGEGDGANIFSKGPKTIIKNTKISGGKSSTHSSVYLRGAEVTIENSEIGMEESYSSAEAHKGCLFFLNNGTTSNPLVTIKDSTIAEVLVGSVTGLTLDGKVLFGTESQNGMYLSAGQGDKITIGSSFSDESKIYVGSGSDTTVAANGAAKIDCFEETNSTEEVAWLLETSGEKLILRKDVSSNHKHCDCGLNDCTATGHTCDASQKWVEWTETDILPATSGYYFLANDMTLTKTAIPADNADVHICFNGKKVTMASSLVRAITGYSNGAQHTGIKYTLTDCQETAGKIATTCKTNNNQGAIIWFAGSNCNLDIHRVTLTAENGAYVSQTNGGLISFQSNGGVLNLYSGTISNGCVESAATNKYSTGGNISMGNSSTMNMYGGTVTGGTSRHGGAWCCGGNIGQTGTCTLNIYGGTVSDGHLTSTSTGYGNGANLAIVGTLNLYGGTITGADAASANGGNIWGDSNSVLNLYGGTIQNGTAKTGAGVFTKSTKANAINIDGTVTFSNNQDIAGKKADLHFDNTSARLTLGSKFAVRSGAPINVSCVSEMTFTANAGSAEDFVPMDAAYEITKNADNTLKYAKKAQAAHKHIEGTNAKIHASTEEGVEWKDLNAELNSLKTANSLASLAAAVAKLPSGNYYLSGNLNLAGQPSAAAGTDIKICLNGYTLTGSRCILTFNASKISVYDCSEGETGMVNGSTSDQGGNWARNNGISIYGGTFKLCSAGTHGGAFAVNGTTIDVYGGKFDGNTAGTNGGNFSTSGATSVLNLKDATIVNGSAKLGPNIYLSAGSKAKLDNVTISGGKSTSTDDHDIYLASGAMLEIVSLPDTSKIVVMMEAPGVFTSNAVPAGYEKYFVAADSESSIIRNADGKLEMKNGHVHCVCGGLIESGHEYWTGVTHTCETAEWKPWNSTTALPQYDNLEVGDNYFYLTADVTLSGDYRPALKASGYASDMEGRNIIICLNGHSIKAGGRFISTLADYSNGVVTQLKNLNITITDCQEECGRIYWKDNVSFGTNQGAFAWLAGENTTVTMYNGFVDCGTMTTAASGAMINAAGLNSVFNMYGGKITAPSTTVASGKYLYGMGAQLSNNCVFNMYGGELTGGSLTGGTNWSVGGNIYVSTPNAVFNMYGGTVSNGTATHGGNIATETGTINIYGGEVTGGTAFYANGGNIMNNKGTLNIYGGTISKGTAQTNGGNIAIAYTDASLYGTFRMYGGTVSDGTAFSNNKNDTHGGNLWTGGKTYITGGTFTGGKAMENVSAAKSATGKATQGYGGNIYVRGGIFELSGATTEVKNGNAAVGGGGIYFLAETATNPITATVSGGTFSGNYAWSGGAIAISRGGTAIATVTVEGSTVLKDNTCGASGYGAGIMVYIGNLIVKGTPTFSNNKSTALTSDIYMNTAVTATKSIDLSGYTGTSKLRLAMGTSETALVTGEFGTCGTWDAATAANYVQAASASQQVTVSGGKLLIQPNN